MEPHHSLTENARITQLLSSYSPDPEPMDRPSRRAVACLSRQVMQFFLRPM